MRGVALVISLLAVVALFGCGDSDSTTSSGGETTATATKESSPAATSKESIDTKPEVKVPSGPPPKQLEIKDLIKGTGAKPKKGDQVVLQYVGVDYASGKEFGASWDRDERFAFPLGSGTVIPGWEEGIKGMKVGGRRELIIPPDLAYGSQGAKSVKPNSTLIFVVDLVAVD